MLASLRKPSLRNSSSNSSKLQREDHIILTIIITNRNLVTDVPMASIKTKIIPGTLPITGTGIQITKTDTTIIKGSSRQGGTSK